MDTVKAECRICHVIEECRHVNLYVVGSEGLMLCHECEMRIVEYVRGMVSLTSKAKMAGYRACKEVQKAKELKQAIQGEGW